MQFTYRAYDNLICSLYENDYLIKDYHDYDGCEKCAILRHDIDYELDRAVEFSVIERERNAKSTYFVLLTSDFYNPASKSSLKVFDELRKNGHEIGLHFDEVRYSSDNAEWCEDYIIENIQKEAELLEKIIDEPVKTVSMHRPSKNTLDSNLEIPGLVNSYSKEFFKKFKYVSDSRMRWREDVQHIISSNEYERLHILTHPFWYKDSSLSIEKLLLEFINGANKKRFNIMNDNITDLESLIDKNNVE